MYFWRTSLRRLSDCSSILPLLIIEFRTRAHPHQGIYSIVPFLNELWQSINFNWSSRRISNFLCHFIFLSSSRSLYISSQAITSFYQQLILHCCQISLLLLWPQYSYITTERKRERQCSSNGVTVKIIRIVCSASQRSFIDDRVDIVRVVEKSILWSVQLLLLWLGNAPLTKAIADYWFG